MKPHGAILEFTAERNADVMRAYRLCLRAHRGIRFDQIGKAIIKMPASRFWVSESRAVEVVSAIFDREPVLDKMRPTKREMFLEIARRVKARLNASPSLSLRQAVAEVIYMPAPKFYMTPRSAMSIVYKVRNGFFKKYIEDAHRSLYSDR